MNSNQLGRISVPKAFKTGLAPFVARQKTLYKVARGHLSRPDLSHANILIYTMGKVGSKSVYKTLKLAFPHANVFHCHFLSQKSLEKIKTLGPHHQHNLSTAADIRRALDRNPEARTYVITVVRDPVDWAISNVYENWQDYFSSVEALKEMRSLEVLNRLELDYALNWLDQEFNKFLGIDIYATPFDRERGWSCFDCERGRHVLVLTIEKFPEIRDEAFMRFLGLANPLWKDTNVTSKKAHGKNYHSVKRGVSLSHELLDIVYSHKYCTNFYTTKQLNMFRGKWSPKSGSEPQG